MQDEFILILHSNNINMYNFWLIDFYHNYFELMNLLEHWPDNIIESQQQLNISEKKYDNNEKYKECWICLIEFVNGDDIIMMNVCNHIFHKNCFKNTIIKCPLCRIWLIT